NPLLCACDIAWLVQNSEYFNFIQDEPMCQDGVLVRDLDPAVYEAVCGGSSQTTP
ncbi:hypothetical protein SK128_021144, partial [Halocaridina rubra]